MAENTPKDSSLQSTKQMLDELDALMERMLSMPVNDLEETAALPQEPAQGPTLAASLTLLEPLESAGPAPAPPAAPSAAPVVKPSPAPRPTAASIPSLKSVLASPTLPKRTLDRRPKAPRLPPLTPRAPLTLKHTARLAKLDEQAPAKEAAAPPPNPEPSPLSNEVVPPTVLTKLDPLLAQVPESSGSSVVAWATAPLIAINQTFDRITLPLGGAGRWLRSHGGRLMMGGSGLVLMLVAVLWALRDWLGWHW